MSIIATYNGLSIIQMPSGIASITSVEWAPMEMVASVTSPTTGQQVTYDWQQSYWQGTLSFPPMIRAYADQWASFLLELRGGVNAFLFGDPKAATPKGTPQGTPVVNGAGQGSYGTGVSIYTVSTRGWKASTSNLLQTGDYIQIGYRLYRVLDAVSSDANGQATVNIWPNLRDAPADGTAIITSNCAGLFRLASPTGQSYSSTIAHLDGINAIKIREAI